MEAPSAPSAVQKWRFTSSTFLPLSIKEILSSTPKGVRNEKNSEPCTVTWDADDHARARSPSCGAGRAGPSVLCAAALGSRPEAEVCGIYDLKK